MNYTHYILFTDTNYGCNVQMVTDSEKDNIIYDMCIEYNDYASMLDDYEYLYVYYAVLISNGNFYNCADVLYAGLMDRECNYNKRIGP